MGTAARNPERPYQPRPTLEPSAAIREQADAQRAESSVNNFSIVLGGPLYDFLRRHRLVHIQLPNILHRTVLLIGLAWLPLLLFSLWDGLAFGHRVRIPFLYDFAVYGRFLLGLPLLLLAEVVIDPAIRQALAEFLDARLVRVQDLTAFGDIVAKVQRWRDSWIPETILFVLAFFPVFLFQHDWSAGAVSSWHTRGRGLTAAGWWFAIFSTPLFRFILYRWTFRYFIWGALLWQISRLDLVLVPTHPDQAAGLNFLSLTQKRFGILFCALGCVFAGHLANRMAFEGEAVSSFKFLISGFIVLFLIVGLLPLLLWMPKLSRVRKSGLLKYGRLANSYSESFHEKWVLNAKSPAQPLLGTPDIQSLADMGSSFALVDAMTVAPITRRLVLQLALQTALPLIPVIVLGTPTPELVHAIVKMLA